MIHTEIVLAIDSLSNDGDGVGRTAASTNARAGRITGGPRGGPWNRQASKSGRAAADAGKRVVFVPGAAPGDTVRVRIVAERKRFLVARLLEVLTPGPGRVIPRCTHFGQCGGCDWQHLDYASQLDEKQSQLAETFERIGALRDIDTHAIAPCDPPWNYRHRIRGELRNGRYHQHAQGTGDLVPIERCEIAHESINARLLAGFDGEEDGRVELAVVARDPGAGTTARQRDGAGAAADSGAAAVTLSTTRVRVLPLTEERSTELGFRQVNAVIEATLVERLSEAVIATPTEHVVDLYCGRGGWTLRLAERCPERRLIGIDAAPDNIRAAQAGKRALGLDNVEFRQGRVERQLGRIPLANAACIVDPPRAGLDRTVVDALNADPVRRLWYVSCHPATLARDLALLCAGVYRVDTVQPLDMFPQTAHLECLVSLSVTS